MRVESTTVDSADADQKQWYRVGGIAAFILGIAYIIIVPLYAHVGAPPTDGEPWFNCLPAKTTVWWVILGLSVLTDFLFVPVAFALYLALKAINRNAMLLATAFVGLFVVLDLAVTWSHYAEKSGSPWTFCRLSLLRFMSYLPLLLVPAFGHRSRLSLSVSPPFGSECLTSVADVMTYYALC